MQRLRETCWILNFFIYSSQHQGAYYIHLGQHQAPASAVSAKAKIMEGGDVVDKGYQPKFGLIYSHILLFSLGAAHC
jgi:ABC-type antimicrobial peptide transport system ATPase subunit